MKRYLRLFCAGALLCVLCVAGVACNTSDLSSAGLLSSRDVMEIKVRAGITDDDFCRHIDIDNIHRTIPVVNRYINGLPGGLDAKQKANALVLFFRSFAGIVDARLHQDEYMRRPAVYFTFMDGSTERELALDFSSTGKVLSYQYDVEDRVRVMIKEGVEISQVFDFINSTSLDIAVLHSGGFVSNMSWGEMQSMLVDIKTRPYIDGQWGMGTYWSSGEAMFSVSFCDIRNRDHQENWLTTMVRYHISEGPLVSHNFIVMVDEGKANEIVSSLSGLNIIESVEICSNRYILADDTIEDGYDDGTAIDSKIRISPVEEYKTSPRTFQLYCTTEKQYGSGGNAIFVVKQLSAGAIDISFKGVAEIGMTADIGPARAYIDLGALAEGTYTLNLHNGGVKQTGRLVVTAQSYTIEMADNPTFGFTAKTLNRIPENTIWGYVAYHNIETEPLVEAFLDDLAGVGAVKKTYLPGYYYQFEIDKGGDIVQPVPGTTGHYFDRLFIYDYSGDLGNLDRLVRRYALSHESEMSIMIYTESGEEFLSWMYDR